MNTALFTTLMLGFALGIKHALDADHVVAVSTIVSQYRNPLKAVSCIRMSIFIFAKRVGRK